MYAGIHIVVATALLSGLLQLGCSVEHGHNLPEVIASTASEIAEFTDRRRSVLLHPEHREMRDSALARAIGLLERQGYEVYNSAAFPDASVALLHLELQHREEELVLAVTMYNPYNPVPERWSGKFQAFVHVIYFRNLYPIDCESGSCVRGEILVHVDGSDGIHESCLSDYFGRDPSERVKCDLPLREPGKRR
jgi:hypothetical protein